jgi:hypothetical protein
MIYFIQKMGEIKMKMNRIAILSIAIVLTILLIFVPVSANQYVTTSADGKYSNPYPNKIYGEEFRSPERPWVSGFGIGELYGDAEVGPLSEFSWYFVICFTTEQNELFMKWMYDRWDTPLIDILDELVPEQVAALPDDHVRYLRDHHYITIGHNPACELTSWSSNEDDHTWTDPCGTHVPPALVPRAIVPGDDRGVVLWESFGSTYTPEVREHLANLGLAIDHQSLDPSFSTSVRAGEYTVVFQGNTPEGERKTWTFVHRTDGSWTDVATGKEIGYDMHYVLAAFCYATSPDYTPPPMMEVLNAQIPTGLQTDSLMAAVDTKASSAGQSGSFSRVAQTRIVSSRSSGIPVDTLLSQAGTLKVSKVNISSFAGTRATTTSTASTASLVSQDTVSSSVEIPAGGKFDMASFAASYRSGGTAIASKSFGSDVLAARGIGG